MHRFKELQVYQKAIVLTSSVRKLSAKFPQEELFGLSSQLRRASDSIALNIAEGAGNTSKKEFSKFIGYAIRSGYECLCCMDIALENNFIKKDDYKSFNERIGEVVAMLVGLQKSIHRQ